MKKGHPHVSASDSAVALAGDNLGQIINLRFGDNSVFNINASGDARRSLPSTLSAIVAQFAKMELAHYGEDRDLERLPKIRDKLHANNFYNEEFISTCSAHLHLLESAYKGVEETNADAKYLVHLKAGRIYQAVRAELIAQEGANKDTRKEVIARHSEMLVSRVIQQLHEEYKSTTSHDITEERADLALSLVVFDAIFDCHVLERVNATG